MPPPLDCCPQHCLSLNSLCEPFHEFSIPSTLLFQPTSSSSRLHNHHHHHHEGCLPDGLSGSLQPLNVSTFLFDDHNHHQHHQIHPRQQAVAAAAPATQGQFLLQLKDELGAAAGAGAPSGGAPSEHIYAVVNTKDGLRRARVVSRSVSRDSSLGQSMTSFSSSSNRNSAAMEAARVPPHLSCPNRDSLVSTSTNSEGPNIFDMIPPPPTYPPPLVQLQSATCNSQVSSHPVNKNSWKRTSRTGLLKSSDADKETVCTTEAAAAKKGKLLSQNNGKGGHPSSSMDTTAPDIVSWLPLLKKTSALATETETTATPPAGVVGFFSQEDPTNFASPKLAAKHNHALALAAVSTRHHQQPTASSVVQKTEQQNDK